MRVPLLVRWPARIKPRRDPLLLSTPDIAPTLLGLMGFARDIPAGAEGRSHADLFLGAAGVRPTSQLYLKVPVGQAGARPPRRQDGSIHAGGHTP